MGKDCKTLECKVKAKIMMEMNCKQKQKLQSTTRNQKSSKRDKLQTNITICKLRAKSETQQDCKEKMKKFVKETYGM
jgi:hypothetical protein